MKIAIIPSIQIRYKNQVESILDLRWIDFLKKKYNKNCNIDILNLNSSLNHDILIITGGNDLPNLKNNKTNIYRNKLDKKFYSLAVKKNIPIVGICHGAMFIANKAYCKVVKTNNHVKRHFIYPSIYGKNIKFKKINTNSFHNYKINLLSNKFHILMEASDKSIECFISRNKKILGIMWHPERFKVYRKFDFDLLDLIK